jgi:murein DD-endopeptidase MepM/ murein hydrolase activator NlpD
MRMVLAVVSVVALALLAPRVALGGEAEPAKVALDWPVCADTSLDFGYATDPESNKIVFHPGADFSGKQGLDVRASAPGKVTLAKEHGSYGLLVEIDHRPGLMTRYASLSTALVNHGDRVVRGQVIGRVDANASGYERRMTAAAQLTDAQAAPSALDRGPHLHFEVWVWDVVRDPLQFMCPKPACSKVHEYYAPKDANTLASWPVAETCVGR